MGGTTARRRRVLGMLVGVTAMVGSSAWVARASGPGPWPSGTGPTTSTTALTVTVPRSTSTTSTTAQPSPTLASSPSQGSTTTTSPSTAPTTIGPGNIPADMQALINSVKRTPANNTAALLEALQPLIDLGLTPGQAALSGMGRFPVGGYASWSDDWLYPRFDGTFHLHQGNDVFAVLGTPVRSPADGTLRQANDPLGGTVLFITETDGTYYYLAHLSAYAPGESPVQRVATGQLVGFVGNTGDAAGGPTHLHFEVHPRGGAAVDPKPFLDSWVTQAIAAVPRVVQQLFPGSAAGRVGSAAAGLALPAGRGDLDAMVAPSQSELAWVAAANPAAGALQLATAEAQTAVDDIDWSVEAQRDTAAALAGARAQQLARSLLAPLTPPVLAVFDGMAPEG